MRIIFFGTYDDERHPRVATLREGFEAHHDDVIECNEPLDLDTSTRIRILRRPWLVPSLLLQVLQSWRRLVVRARALPPPQVVLVGYLGHFDVHLARRLWPDACLLVDHLIFARDTAVDRRAVNRLLLRVLGILDRAAVETADIPFVDTEAHRELLPPPARRRSVVVPVGAPGRWFRRPAPLPGEGIRVVFFGLYTPLQGTPVIGRALALLADDRRLSFTMVGDGQDLEETQREAAASPRVEWQRWISPELLPEIVAEHHVCLGIFGTTDKARRVVPNKVFQGAAAGCAVVTSATAPQRAALGPAGVLVPPGSPRALAQALGELASNRDRLYELRVEASSWAERHFRPKQVVRPLRSSLLERLDVRHSDPPDLLSSP